MPEQETKQEPAQKPGGEDKQQPNQGSTRVVEQKTKDVSEQNAIQESKPGVKQDQKQKPKRALKQAPNLPKKETSKQPPAKKPNGDLNDGEDLTTILDESQRADLTLLLANATDSMRKLIEDNFDASGGLNKSLLRENMTEDEKLMSADVDPGTADVPAFDRERKLRERYEKELSTAKMKTLRSDALKAFDEWRQTVMERVGQVVNSERIANAQVEKDAKTRKAQPQAPDQNPLESVLKKPPDQGTKLKFKDLYPPIKTPLTKMNMRQRTLIVHSLLLLLLSLEHYNAPSRVLLLHLVSSLKLPLKTFEQDEATVAKGLLEAVKELTADEETKKKAEANKENRKWKVGLATAAGAAVIGISGGMAAPLVSAGVGTIMGSLGLGATAAAGYLGSVAGSTVLVGALFGAYGGRMTGQMMDHYAREVEDFEFLPVHSRNKTSENAEEGPQQASEHNHKLRVTICISGWLTEKDEVVSPWKVIGRGAEVFALKWELEALLNLGNAMNGLVQSAAWGYAQKQFIQQTIFADLVAAMWPIGLVKAAGLIDNPFSVAKGRSEKAGEVLADALINRAQGERPITLIGYSLGARVIYTCLMSLAKRKAFGLIESAVLIGAPTPSDTSDWRTMRAVVTARLVNVYSENDYVLGFMYRTSSVQYGVAGLQKIEGLSGVENVNVSEDVKGHLRYRYLIGSILKKIGFEDIDMQAVEEEHIALEKMEEEEKKNSLRAQKNRMLRRQSTGGNEDEAKEAEDEANDIQKQVAAKTQKSLVTRVVEYIYLPKTPSAKDAEKNLGLIQKAAADPSEAGAVAMEAVKDIQASGQSYAQWAAQKLSSLPGRGGGATKAASDPSKSATRVADTASQTASKRATTAQSYTQTAASYLPTFRGGSKKSSEGPPGAVGGVAREAENAIDQTPVASTVQDTAKPTMTNASKVAADTAEGAKDAAAGVASQSRESASGAASPAQSKVADVASSTPKAAGRAARNTASSAQGYTSKVAAYLPKFGGINKATQDRSKSKGDAAKEPSKAVSNASNEATTAAGKAAKGPAKKAEEAANSANGPTKPKPSQADVQKASDDRALSAQSYTSRAAEYLPSLPSISGRGQKSATAEDKRTSSSVERGESPKPPVAARPESTPSTRKASKNNDKSTDGVKESESTDKDRSYTSLASDYLPRMPSVPGLGRGKSNTKPKPPAPDRSPSEPKKTAPDVERTSSEAPAKAAPELKRKASDGTKSIAKLDRKSSGASEPAPKPEKQNSEVKKSIPKLDKKASGEADSSPVKLSRTVSGSPKSVPKLDRSPSGMESPPAKLSRTPSAAQSPSAAKQLERTTSGVKSVAPKLDRVPSGMKKPQETVQKGVSGLTGALSGK